MTTGHTKFDVDLLFALLTNLTTRMNISTISELVQFNTGREEPVVQFTSIRFVSNPVNNSN